MRQKIDPEKVLEAHSEDVIAQRKHYPYYTTVITSSEKRWLKTSINKTFEANFKIF